MVVINYQVLFSKKVVNIYVKLHYWNVVFQRIQQTALNTRKTFSCDHIRFVGCLLLCLFWFVCFCFSFSFIQGAIGFNCRFIVDSTFWNPWAMFRFVCNLQNIIKYLNMSNLVLFNSLLNDIRRIYLSISGSIGLILNI